jgi:hypothetical protein
LIAVLPSRLRSRIFAIVAVLGLAACSDNLTSATTSSTTPVPASIKLTLVSPIPSLGSSGTFTLAVTAYSASGATITGGISPDITLVSSDGKDLILGASAITVGTSNLLVAYDGAALPGNTTITASAGTVTTSYTVVSGATPAAAAVKI